MESPNFEQAPRMLRSLIERCWHGDRRRRPTAAQVVAALDELAPEFGLSPTDAPNLTQRGAENEQRGGRGSGGGGKEGGGGGSRAKWNWW